MSETVPLIGDSCGTPSNPSCFVASCGSGDTCLFNFTCDPADPYCNTVDSVCDPEMGDADCSHTLTCVRPDNTMSCSVSTIGRYAYWCPEERQFIRDWTSSCVVDNQCLPDNYEPNCFFASRNIDPQTADPTSAEYKDWVREMTRLKQAKSYPLFEVTKTVDPNEWPNGNPCNTEITAADSNALGQAVIAGLTNDYDTAFEDHPGTCLPKSVVYIKMISHLGGSASFEDWNKNKMIRGPLKDSANIVESVPVVSFHKPYGTSALTKIDGYSETFVMVLVHMTDKSYLMFLAASDGEVRSALDLNLVGTDERTSLARFQQWIDPLENT